MTILRYEEDIERVIGKIIKILYKDLELRRKYNLRWLAIKILEGDEEILNKIKNRGVFSELLPIIKHERKLLVQKYGDLELYFTQAKYKFIEEIIKEVVVRKEERLSLSDLLDKAVLDKYTSIPIFLIILWMIFQFTIKMATPFCDIIGDFFAWLSKQTWLYTKNPIIDSILFGDYGIINGLGTVLSFTPLIFFLYLSLSILEDSGYMARAAFIMDRPMRKVGLSGRSIISMILGFGCNVPAIYSARAIPNEEDRIITILVNPLMLCSARLTTLSLLAVTFFGSMAGEVIFSLYLIGISLAVILALVFRKIFFKGRITPFILELPDYQVPTMRVIITHAWWKVSLFFRKAFTVIVSGLLLIQILGSIEYGTFTWIGSTHVDRSILAAIGKFLSPIFAPLGWDWKLVVAAIFGFVAKEIVIGATAMLYGASEDTLPQVLGKLYTPVQAYAYMVFILIYVKK